MHGYSGLEMSSHCWVRVQNHLYPITSIFALGWIVVRPSSFSSANGLSDIPSPLSNLLPSNQATRQRGMPGCPVEGLSPCCQPRPVGWPGLARPGLARPGQASPLAWPDQVWLGVAWPGQARPGQASAASSLVANHAWLRPIHGLIGDARLKASKACPVEGVRLTPGC